MRRAKLVVVGLAVLGMVAGVQERAWTQLLSSTPEVPTTKGETPAFTTKGFEFTFGNFIASDFSWDSSDVGGTEGSIPLPRGPLGTICPGGFTDGPCADGVAKRIAVRARDTNLTWTAAQTQLSFGVKGPGLWGGATRGYVEFDFIGTDGGTSNPNPTSNIGPRLRHAYVQMTWPHSQTGIGDVDILIGQTVPLFIIQIPETTEDIVLLGNGGIFGREQLAWVTTTIPLGVGNNLFLGVNASMPNSNLFGNLVPGPFVPNAASPIGEASSSGVPYLNFAVKFRTDILGRANYFGGLVPAEVAVGGFYGREILQKSLFEPGENFSNIGKTPWGIAGSLILPILGTRTEKRAGLLSVKGAGWYSENGNAYFLHSFQGIVATPRDGAPLSATGTPGDVNGDGVVSQADVVADPNAFEFHNTKGAGGHVTVQYNPLENLMLYVVLAGSWTTSTFRPGTVVVEGPNLSIQRSRAIEGGFILNLNAALAVGAEFRYIRNDFADIGVSPFGFGGRGEDLRWNFNTTYAF